MAADPNNNNQKEEEGAIPSADAVAHAFEGLTHAPTKKEAAPDSADSDVVRDQIIDIEKELEEVSPDTLPLHVEVPPSLKVKSVTPAAAGAWPASTVPKKISTPEILTKVPTPPKEPPVTPAVNTLPEVPEVPALKSSAKPFFSPAPFKEIPDTPNTAIVHNAKPEKKEPPQRQAEPAEDRSTAVPSPPVLQTNAPVAKVVAPVAASEVPAQAKPIVTIEEKSAPTPAPVQLETKRKLSVLEQLRALTSSPLHPLRTYKSDAEDTVKNTRASLVTMAAAEENRRTRVAPSEEAQPAKRPRAWKGLALSVASLIFVVSGLGLIGYTYFNPFKASAPLEGRESLLRVDEQVLVPIDAVEHAALMATLAVLRDETQLSLGLIRELRLSVDVQGESPSEQPSAADVFVKLAPTMPEELIRSLQPQFMLGTHVFEGNQGFIVFTVDSYEQAYAGMIGWERTMHADLLPFMDRRPRPRLPEEERLGTTTPRVIESAFRDSIVRNRDARVLQNSEGDIVLLYVFIDQRTVVITTNEYTLAEIVSRLGERR